MHHKWKSYDVWFLKYGANRQKFLSFWTIFYPFIPLWTQKIRTNEQLAWRYYHFTNDWCMTPEIWNTADRISCHFGPFFALLPPNNLKYQNFEKLEKRPGNIIILHMCTINDNDMMFGPWDMKCDEQNFLLFWTVFCHFTSLTTRKMKILKNHIWQSNDVCFLRYRVRRTKNFVILDHFLSNLPLENPKNQNFEKIKKKHQEILSFDTSVPKIRIICYTVPKIWRVAEYNWYFWFWTIFCPFGTWKIKISKKMKKKAWRYYHFTQVYQKLGSYIILFLRYGAWRM